MKLTVKMMIALLLVILGSNINAKEPSSTNYTVYVKEIVDQPCYLRLLCSSA